MPAVTGTIVWDTYQTIYTTPSDLAVHESHNSKILLNCHIHNKYRQETFKNNLNLVQNSSYIAAPDFIAIFQDI